MATVDDIDTKALVGKFLQRQLITSSADDEADKSEEIQALLETAANAFLLAPQTALPLIYRGKNSLQQLVQSDIDILDFLIGAIADIRNPGGPIEDVSDLVEAQTALIELDRLKKVGDELPAFQRYKAAINRFLNNELAVFLKRNARREFERSGDEARQDIFTVLPQFGATHQVMSDNLRYLQDSVSDFRSVDLNRIVSARTIQRVRTSLRELKSLVEQDALSKTVTATELLSGAASLESITSNLDIFDPTISTVAGLPPRRTITIRPEQLAATAVSTDGPWDALVADRVFSLGVNPLSASPISLALELPDIGVEDTDSNATVYVTSSEDVAAATYVIPASGTLYIHLGGISIPEQEIPITAGTRTVAQILTDLNAGLVDATAIAFKGGNRFLIYIDSTLGTGITVRGAPSGALGVINTDPSVHDVLGFETNQASLPRGVFDSLSLYDSLDGRLPGVTAVVEADKLRLTSDSLDTTTSSLAISTPLAVVSTPAFSASVESQPSYVELIEDGVALLPATEGVFVESIVTSAEATVTGSATRSLNNEAITSLIGTEIYFASVIPRGTSLDVVVTAPAVAATQLLVSSLSDFVGVFDDDFQNLQLALSPILSSPTQAQVNDSLRVLNRIRDRLTSTDGGVLEALQAVVITPDSSPSETQAEVIIQSFEERGLDRAGGLLVTGKFTEFFALSKRDASRSSRLLSAMEDFITKDVPESFNEEDIDDDNAPRGTNRDELILDAVEPNDKRERLVEDL